jgi:putative transposase
MREFVILAIHLITTVVKLARPGGVRAVAAESLLLKHQLQINNRSRRRSPNLTSFDRILLGLFSLFIHPRRVARLAVVVKSSSLLRFHKALVERKYRRLFSSSRRRRRPGSKGPSAELIAVIVDMKRRNPRWGCVHIAQQINYAYGLDIDKDVVRRVLAKHYRPESGNHGPSWLTIIASAKERVWSVDLFRCESILLRSHWVLVVLDIFTRRIVGFGIQVAYVEGVSVCRMFNRATAGEPKPKYLSTDHDPLLRFHGWLANLRVLEIEELKSVPHLPVSHPFVERLIGTIRREYLDHQFFWNAIDLSQKLEEFKTYYNAHRVHRTLDGNTPAFRAGSTLPTRASLAHYRWQHHCRGLFQTPIPA